MKIEKNEFKGNFIGNEFHRSATPSGERSLKSPADLTDEIGPITWSYADIDVAVERAQKAFQSWRKTPLAERIEILKRYQAALEKHKESIAQTISRETGKPFWESRTEVGAMVGKVNITIQESLPLVHGFEKEEMQPQTRGVLKYKPLGVLSVIGPFNFPGHLANGHIVPALITGNTVIFKPSEKTPITAQKMAECLLEAGVPSGVFQVVHGDGEVGRRLAIHEGTAGNLFTGSYDVGLAIKKDTLHQYWKLNALEMGGKNAAIVWDDADLNVAVREILFGAYVTSGQRCSCTSRVILHSKIADAFVEHFHAQAKALAIGHPWDDVFMGPVIDSVTLDRYTKFMGIAQREGAEVVMRGKALELKPGGYFVTPSICRFDKVSVESVKKSVYQQNELFAPNVAIMETDDLHEAIDLANATQFGLVASVFTKSDEVYQQAWDDLEVGLVNLNKSTAGASSALPFGGLKKSGNHHPTALPATLYCTYPVASLETRQLDGSKAAYPGFNWKTRDI